MTPPTAETSDIPPDLAAAHANALPLRALAIHLFEEVVFEHQTLDRVLQNSEPFKNVSPLDRALIRMILATTFRRLGQIDEMLSIAMNGQAPHPRLLQSLLRTAVAQIMFMKVPDHAAVNLSVSLAETLDLARQKGLVNAVLRRVTREGGALSTRQDIPRLNIPAWILDGWVKAYGARTALECGQASLVEAGLDLTLKDPSDGEYWAKLLQADRLPTDSLRLTHAGQVENLPGFHEGAWWIQDAAAALPVLCMGPVQGFHVVDLCAAPGGKTAQLAAAGAHVTALDNNARRLETLRRNMDRLGLHKNAEIVEADSMSYQPDHKVDAVLLDAPCTATGTIRRNPDLLVHRRPEDLTRMAAIQRQLLRNAATMVKPGGMLIYAVCSLQPEEGEDQLAWFLSENKNYVIDPIDPASLNLDPAFVTPQGVLRILPTFWGERGGIDGFFTARMRLRG